MAILRENMLRLLTAAFERAATRLGPKEHWPDDLRARDIVRLLREHSPAVAAKATNEDVSR
jgi:hypothetical protein